MNTYNKERRELVEKVLAMIAAETIACAFIARELWYMLFPSFIIVLQS